MLCVSAPPGHLLPHNTGAQERCARLTNVYCRRLYICIYIQHEPCGVSTLWIPKILTADFSSEIAKDLQLGSGKGFFKKQTFTKHFVNSRQHRAFIVTKKAPGHRAGNAHSHQ